MYAGVHALECVSLEIERGEVHALCGENGAGKSTLIKCLSGVATPESGLIKVDKSRLCFGSVSESESLGITVIHQESTSFPDLSAVDNVFVGRELRNRFGLLDHRRMRDETQKLLTALGEDFDILCPLAELSLANRQMVSIARALSRECKLLIMDEPTASLSLRETDVLMRTVKRLKNQGVTVLYVSHRLNEIFELADRVSVLRDGRHVETCKTSQIREVDLIRLMVGREPSRGQEVRRKLGDTRLEVRELSGGQFRNVSMSIRAGEIVGLAGLVGAGRSELARSIVGVDRYRSGEVVVNGAAMVPGSVQASLSRGVALVPEDRQHQGLVLPMRVSENMSLAVLHQLANRGVISSKSEEKLVSKTMERLNVKAASPSVSAESLSGGNQQKVVLGKWLAAKPDVLILDEPTRGVDVGAKSQVHQLIQGLASDGMATLLISSELPELLAICDRILVMREGSISGEVQASSTTQEEILALALPSSQQPQQPSHA